MNTRRRFIAAASVALAATFGMTSVVSNPVGAAPASATVASTVTPGAFCKTSHAGRIDYTVRGVKMRCEQAPNDSRYRWREVVK